METSTEEAAASFHCIQSASPGWVKACSWLWVKVVLCSCAWCGVLSCCTREPKSTVDIGIMTPLTAESTVAMIISASSVRERYRKRSSAAIFDLSRGLPTRSLWSHRRRLGGPNPSFEPAAPRASWRWRWPPAESGLPASHGSPPFEPPSFEPPSSEPPPAARLSSFDLGLSSADSSSSESSESLLGFWRRLLAAHDMCICLAQQLLAPVYVARAR